MRIKRSRFDPFDINRARPFIPFEEGECRVRVWRNETWKGYREKFDLVHVVQRGDDYEEYCQGIPLEHALDACLAMQKFIDWAMNQKYGAPARKPLSEVDLAYLNKSNRKR
jgi:hypothetical protein